MNPSAHRSKMPFLALLVALWACGDDGHSHADGPAQISTLAYVVTECSEGSHQGFALKQKLLIRRGDAEPVAVAEFPAFGPEPLSGLCRLAGIGQFGAVSSLVGAFQRLGISPDGSLLVFEVTDDHSYFPGRRRADQEGIWIIRADGTGLRRIAHASRSPCVSADWDVISANVACFFSFNRDGSKITFSDMGPGPGGDAAQIFTMDLATGERNQVTRLPPTPDLKSGYLPLVAPSFLDDKTIAFESHANPIIDGEELNPEGERRIFSVKTHDPDTLQVVPFFAEPGNARKIIDTFQITGPEPAARGMFLDGWPVNGPGTYGYVIREAFVLDSERVLQLTDFKRSDTESVGMSADRQRVFFYASTNKLGTNPFKNCQVFSIDRNGGDLRQLTNFDEGETSLRGCYGNPPGWTRPSSAPGCVIQVYGNLRQDPLTDSILFASTCDPFGTNPNGSQIFAIRPDGTGLRQLTHARGMVTAPDGTVTVELPGPAAATALPR